VGRLIERSGELVEIDWFCQERECAGIADNSAGGRPAGNEDDARGRIFGDDVATGGGAVEFRHPIIHQDDVGMMLVVGLDGFHARADDGDNLVVAMPDEVRQRGADGPLVIGNQDAHARFEARREPLRKGARSMEQGDRRGLTGVN
jgi:hypothetical protein